MEEGYTAPWEMADPCGEDSHMPVPGLVHRYPDRVLFLVTDRCASYCRYCTRSRVVSGAGDQELHTDFDEAFAYLEKHTEVRDVLFSGGDALLLPMKNWSGCSAVSGPSRISSLSASVRACRSFSRSASRRSFANAPEVPPLWMSVHVNHPRELTTEVREALGRLVDHGIPLGNQSVFLAGVNDDVETMRELVHKLLLCRVRRITFTSATSSRAPRT